MAKEDYIIKPIYAGGYSSLSPGYGNFAGYRMSISELGAPTKPDTANQLQQVNQLLNQGIIPIEVGTIKPEEFDQIPKQHFKEINRLAKLTGAKISVHAPIVGVEPSGITEQGFSETNRETIERQLSSVIEKAAELDENGKIPITIHSSGLPGTEYKMTPEGKKMERMIVIDKDSGKIVPIQEDKVFYPGEDLDIQKTLNPTETLEKANKSMWENSLSNITYRKINADEYIERNLIQIQHLLPDLDSGRVNIENLTPSEKRAYENYKTAKPYLEETHTQIKDLFSRAYEFGNEGQRKKLVEISENFKKDLELNKEKGVIGLSNAMGVLISNLNKQELAPRIYVPIEEFAIEKSATTFANVALNTYDKFKDKSPTINIENLFPGMAFSYGEDMKSLILESRKKFVENAIKPKNQDGLGMSRGDAEKQAEKMIGMTLDVGHLNIAKKKGFEDKDLLKEVEQISKFVKHVHLTDNFGFSDSHLPPGMGNVPIKEIMEKLDKAGFKGRKIVEAGGFAQQFGISPFPYVLENVGPPMYSSGMGPYWNQAAGLQQDYSSGYGMMLPQTHFETFGAGFSQLPSELGGQKPGAKGSRVSGNPME